MTNGLYTSPSPSSGLRSTKLSEHKFRALLDEGRSEVLFRREKFDRLNET